MSPSKAIKFLSWLSLLLVASIVEAAPAKRAGSTKWDVSTSFELWPENIKLLKWENIGSTTNLPYWFSYDLYKKVYNKTIDPNEETQRHLIYVDSCVETLINRVLFRILAATDNAFIDSNSDRYEHELYKNLKPDEIIELRIRDPVDEEPIKTAISLVKAELKLTESKNQLERYLEEFEINRTEIFKDPVQKFTPEDLVKMVSTL